jgi:hypothetical protein
MSNDIFPSFPTARLRALHELFCQCQLNVRQVPTLGRIDSASIRKPWISSGIWRTFGIARKKRSSIGTTPSSARSRSRINPRSCNIWAAKHFCSRTRPRRRCSVPMCESDRRSASAAASARTRLPSLLRGRSREVPDFLADHGVGFDLFADRFHRRVRAQETVAQGLVFAQQPKQEMFGLNITRSEVAGFISCEKDRAPHFSVERSNTRIPPKPGFPVCSASRTGIPARPLPR